MKKYGLTRGTGIKGIELAVYDPAALAYSKTFPKVTLTPSEAAFLAQQLLVALFQMGYDASANPRKD